MSVLMQIYAEGSLLLVKSTVIGEGYVVYSSVSLSLCNLLLPLGVREICIRHLNSILRLLLIFLIFIVLAVGALRVTRLRIVHPSQSHCYRQGGGALGTRMNLFDRFARVVKVGFENCSLAFTE